MFSIPAYLFSISNIIFHWHSYLTVGCSREAEITEIEITILRIISYYWFEAKHAWYGSIYFPLRYLLLHMNVFVLQLGIRALRFAQEGRLKSFKLLARQETARI